MNVNYPIRIPPDKVWSQYSHVSPQNYQIYIIAIHDVQNFIFCICLSGVYNVIKWDIVFFCNRIGGIVACYNDSNISIYLTSYFCIQQFGEAVTLFAYKNSNVL